MTKKQIEIKYQSLFEVLDLDFEQYKKLIALRDQEISELKQTELKIWHIFAALGIVLTSGSITILLIKLFSL